MVCAAQPEDGSWKNVDGATRGLTRAQLRFICQDQILNGEPYPPGPPWYVHLWGSCQPAGLRLGRGGGRRGNRERSETHPGGVRPGVCAAVRVRRHVSLPARAAVDLDAD